MRVKYVNGGRKLIFSADFKIKQVRFTLFSTENGYPESKIRK